MYGGNLGVEIDEDVLARIIHEASTTAADPGMSTAHAWFVRAPSLRLLDVLLKYACGVLWSRALYPRLSSPPRYEPS